jgi:hypothetical protein
VVPKLNVLDGSVLTLGFSGNNNIGLHVDGAGTTLTVTNASISLPGIGTDIVVDVTGAASATITGSTLKTTDAKVVVNSAGNNSGVQFGGSSQSGQTGGTVSMTSGTVNQTSSSGQAILLRAPAPAVTNS